MAKMKLQSWLLLAILAIIVAFAAGIRQGVNVEKNNKKFIRFYEVSDKKCGIQYVLPDTVPQDSGVISIDCDAQASGAAAMLAQKGFAPIDVASGSGSMRIWIKAPQELTLLLQNTIRFVGRQMKTQ